MNTARNNTLVVDFSGLPSRPDTAVVEDFIYNKMKLEQTDALSIQLRNIHHCVYIEMEKSEKPLEYQRAHNCKHSMQVEGKRLKIPVYRSEDAVYVRVNDLPPYLDLDHNIVVEFLSQYGTVLSKRFEYWRNFFGGVKNGVRVFRMLLSKPIPSFVKIGNFESTVSYQEQVKTCKKCSQPLHPRTKCVVTRQWQTVAAETSQHNSQAPISHHDFPALEQNFSKRSDHPKKAQQQNNQQQHEQQHLQKENTTLNLQANDEDDDNGSSSSTESIACPSSNAKRRLSTKKNAVMKKPCQLASPNGSVELQNCFVVLSPVDGNTEENC